MIVNGARKQCGCKGFEPPQTTLVARGDTVVLTGRLLQTQNIDYYMHVEKLKNLGLYRAMR